jgi:hypothetical protein
MYVTVAGVALLESKEASKKWLIYFRLK